MRVGYGLSETGMVRANNEDALLVEGGAVGRLPNLFAVADGMGGHNAGEIASREALAAFRAFAAAHHGFRYTQDLLSDCARHANAEVYRISQENPAASGMGTTLSVCAIDDDNLYYAHVGDSRIYIVSNSEIKAVTRDHSLVAELVESGAITEEEAREHPQRNIMTRALGTDEELRVDSGYVPLAAGDAVLLCSDGLTGMMDDVEILSVISNGGGAEAIVNRLVRRAVAKGGYDNVTVIYIE